MGCGSYREESKIRIEEELIKNAENDLNFWRFTTLEIINKIKSRSVKNYISKSRFNQILTEMRIAETDPAFLFYSNFLVDGRTEKYGTDKLITLGILLAKGSIRQKAELLFENFDIDSSGTFSINEIGLMLEYIIEISLVLLPNLASTFELNRKMSFALKLYSIKLEKSIAEISLFYRVSLTQGREEDVHQREFLSRFSNPDIQHLLFPSKLRLFAVETYSNLIANNQLVLDFIRSDPYIFEIQRTA